MNPIIKDSAECSRKQLEKALDQRAGERIPLPADAAALKAQNRGDMQKYHAAAMQIREERNRARKEEKQEKQDRLLLQALVVDKKK